mgnify:CR=1 FL=1
MQAYQERVVLEKKELDEKIGKLSPFIGSEKFLSVKEDEANRLRNQLSIMIDYSNILGERIANF